VRAGPPGRRSGGWRVLPALIRPPRADQVAASVPDPIDLTAFAPGRRPFGRVEARPATGTPGDDPGCRHGTGSSPLRAGSCDRAPGYLDCRARTRGPARPDRRGAALPRLFDLDADPDGGDRQGPGRRSGARAAGPGGTQDDVRPAHVDGNELALRAAARPAGRYPVAAAPAAGERLVTAYGSRCPPGRHAIHAQLRRRPPRRPRCMVELNCPDAGETGRERDLGQRQRGRLGQDAGRLSPLRPGHMASGPAPSSAVTSAVPVAARSQGGRPGPRRRAGRRCRRRSAASPGPPRRPGCSIPASRGRRPGASRLQDPKSRPPGRGCAAIEPHVLRFGG